MTAALPESVSSGMSLDHPPPPEPVQIARFLLQLTG